MKNWLARKRYVTKLCMEIADLHDCMQRRSQLIADQDAEITRLRRELRDANEMAAFWQGRAANP